MAGVVYSWSDSFGPKHRDEQLFNIFLFLYVFALLQLIIFLVSFWKILFFYYSNERKRTLFCFLAYLAVFWDSIFLLFRYSRLFWMAVGCLVFGPGTQQQNGQTRNFCSKLFISNFFCFVFVCVFWIGHWSIKYLEPRAANLACLTTFIANYSTAQEKYGSRAKVIMNPNYVSWILFHVSKQPF